MLCMCYDTAAESLKLQNESIICNLESNIDKAAAQKNQPMWLH